MTVSEKLKAAFVAGLGVSASADFETLEYRGIPQWDSVAHMQLVMEIENAFDIMLSTDDVIGMSSFRVAREMVLRHGARDA